METRMTITELDDRYREMLNVPADANVGGIVELIQQEDLVTEDGFLPLLFSEEVDGQRLWACTFVGFWGRWVEVSPESPYVTGNVGYPTQELAALDALRFARGLPRPMLR
jgi:hypothetical protein